MVDFYITQRLQVTAILIFQPLQYKRLQVTAVLIFQPLQYNTLNGVLSGVCQTQPREPINVIKSLNAS